MSLVGARWILDDAKWNSHQDLFSSPILAFFYQPQRVQREAAGYQREPAVWSDYSRPTIHRPRWGHLRRAAYCTGQSAFSDSIVLRVQETCFFHISFKLVQVKLIRFRG